LVVIINQGISMLMRKKADAVEKKTYFSHHA